jgi:hypothetical protein
MGDPAKRTAPHQAAAAGDSARKAAAAGDSARKPLHIVWHRKCDSPSISKGRKGGRTKKSYPSNKHLRFHIQPVFCAIKPIIT